MSRLTVTEKEHWKSRIEHRINRAIEKLEASDPDRISTLRADARARAIKTLGIAEMHLKRESIKASIKDLTNESDQLEVAIYEKLFGPNKQCGYVYGRQSDIEIRIGKEANRIEEELLSKDKLGKQIVKLRVEKESLLDTVWLATSSQQVRELWNQVSVVLGDEPTALQTEILSKAIDA